MRKGYSQEIRAEAIARRYQGKDWKGIQALIQEKYGVRPGIRQMQKWFEVYKGSADDPTGAKFIAKQIEETANLVKPVVQAKMMVEVMPLWSQLQEQYRMTVADAGWIAFLAFFESQMGRESFDRIVDEYRELRDKLGKRPGQQSQPK